MTIEKLSSLLLKDTLHKAVEMGLEDEFIGMLKEELVKRESEINPAALAD